MKKLTHLFVIGICIFYTKADAQTKEYSLKDIFFPELKGQVRSFTEIILTGNDTLVIHSINYSASGYRTSEYTRSTHPEMGFTNASVCYKTVAKEIRSANCNNDSLTNTTIALDEQGNVIQVDMSFPGETIGYVPYYNKAGRLESIYTSLSKDGTYKFIGTLIYTFNKDGSVKESSAEGGDQLQGKTKYTYNDQKLLVKTIRSGFDKDKVFQMEFSDHDSKGNWTVSKYQNGVIVKRVIQYY